MKNKICGWFLGVLCVGCCDWGIVGRFFGVCFMVLVRYGWMYVCADCMYGLKCVWMYVYGLYGCVWMCVRIVCMYVYGCMYGLYVCVWMCVWMVYIY